MRRSIAAVALLLLVLAVSPSLAQGARGKVAVHQAAQAPSKGLAGLWQRLIALVGLSAAQGSGSGQTTATAPPVTVDVGGGADPDGNH
jgi:hypothetical protein